MQRTTVKALTEAKRNHDSWYDELVDLASEGNEEAVHDLWLSYGCDFAGEGSRR